MLELSSALYAADVSFDTICIVLAALAAANYLLFDGKPEADKAWQPRTRHSAAGL